MVSTDYATGAGAKRRAYDAAVYTTNQRAALLQSNRLLTLYIPSGGKVPRGGSSPPTAPIEATFTHNYHLRIREDAGGTRQSAVVPQSIYLEYD